MVRDYGRDRDNTLEDIEERNYQYRRDVDADRNNGWWAGILPVLLIPLLLLGAGFALFNAFNSDQVNRGETASTNNSVMPTSPATAGNDFNPQVGIGGAPNTSVSIAPSRAASPTTTVRDDTTTERSDTQMGVGGAAPTGAVSMPTAAPRTGGGGLSE